MSSFLPTMLGVIVVFAAGWQDVAGQERVRATCPASAWSAAQDVEGMVPRTPVRVGGEVHQLALVREPSLAAVGDTLYVVGLDLPVIHSSLDSIPVPAPPVVVLRIPGGGIEPPAGPFWFMSPLVATDLRGRLHLVWAEPDTGTPLIRSRFVSPNAVQLWHTWRLDGNWQEPQPIYRARQGVSFRWGANHASFLIDPAGTPRLVFREGDRLVHLVHRSSGWEAQHIPIRLGGLPTMGALSGSRLAIAYTGIEPGVEGAGADGRTNSLLILRSEDQGRTWAGPELVHRPDDGSVQRKLILAGPDGELHLLWEETTGSEFQRALVHAVSSDEGRTWSQPVRLTNAERVRNSRAVIDPCGSIHVAFEAWAADRRNASLGYLRWDGNWSTLQFPFPELHSMEIAMALDGVGRPWVYWSSRPTDAEGLIPWFEPVTAVLQ